MEAKDCIYERIKFFLERGDFFFIFFFRKGVWLVFWRGVVWLEVVLSYLFFLSFVCVCVDKRVGKGKLKGVL